jgi:hypothetical protein
MSANAKRVLDSGINIELYLLPEQCLSCQMSVMEALKSSSSKYGAKFTVVVITTRVGDLEAIRDNSVFPATQDMREDVGGVAFAKLGDRSTLPMLVIIYRGDTVQISDPAHNLAKVDSVLNSLHSADVQEPIDATSRVVVETGSDRLVKPISICRTSSHVYVADNAIGRVAEIDYSTGKLNYITPKITTVITNLVTYMKEHGQAVDKLHDALKDGAMGTLLSLREVDVAGNVLYAHYKGQFVFQMIDSVQRTIGVSWGSYIVGYNIKSGKIEYSSVQTNPRRNFSNIAAGNGSLFAEINERVSMDVARGPLTTNTLRPVAILDEGIDKYCELNLLLRESEKATYSIKGRNDSKRLLEVGEKVAYHYDSYNRIVTRFDGDRCDNYASEYILVDSIYQSMLTASIVEGGNLVLCDNFGRAILIDSTSQPRFRQGSYELPDGCIEPQCILNHDGVLTLLWLTADSKWHLAQRKLNWK